ncbi:MAG: helix-turn-helix domain-containing protein [Verrucomicrobia bacterium]|nr:helix-turn-helix domain-containing protein [Verrucomicrobiota bacterium]
MTLAPEEQQVFESLGTDELAQDEVIRRSGLPASTVSVVLLRLEMKRLVRQLPGKRFLRGP